MRTGHGATTVRRGRVLGLVAIVATIATLLGTLTAAPVAADSAIETAYAAPGTWAVSTATVTDGAGGTYVLHYPTDLGAGGVDHAIITWGNGTGATPANYPGILNQLASWGFVVVASTSTTTGYGTEMLAGVNHLLGENANPASPFYQKLDPTKVGAAGHSQGASGALNATALSNGLITSTVPVSLPNPIFVDEVHKTDFTKIVDPVFFVHGGWDPLSTGWAQTGYYDGVVGAAAKATLKGGGHNVIQNSGGRMVGYITAWFMYTLRGDTGARAAFVGSPPEINTNTAWTNAAQKNLP